MNFATQTFKKPIFGNLTSTFQLYLTTAKMTALQGQIQSIFPVVLTYSGVSGNYTVTITAKDTAGFEGALAFLFPKSQPYILTGKPFNP